VIVDLPLQSTPAPTCGAILEQCCKALSIEQGDAYIAALVPCLPEESITQHSKVACVIPNSALSLSYIEAVLSSNQRLEQRVQQTLETLSELQCALEQKSDEVEQLQRQLSEEQNISTTDVHHSDICASRRQSKPMNLQDTISAIQVTLAEDVAAAESAMEEELRRQDTIWKHKILDAQRSHEEVVATLQDRLRSKQAIARTGPSKLPRRGVLPSDPAGPKEPEPKTSGIESRAARVRQRSTETQRDGSSIPAPTASPTVAASRLVRPIAVPRLKLNERDPAASGGTPRTNKTPRGAGSKTPRGTSGSHSSTPRDDLTTRRSTGTPPTSERSGRRSVNSEPTTGRMSSGSLGREHNYGVTTHRSSGSQTSRSSPRALTDSSRSSTTPRPATPLASEVQHSPRYRASPRESGIPGPTLHVSNSSHVEKPVPKRVFGDSREVGGKMPRWA